MDMERKQKILGFSFLSAISLVAVYFIYLFYTIDNTTRAAIIAASGAASAAIITHHMQKRREISLKIRDKKTEAYGLILNLFRSMLDGIKSGDMPKEEDFRNKFYEINYALAMHGSDEVILEWKLYFEIMTNLNPADESEKILKSQIMRLNGGKLISVIRKDLGFNDTKIGINELSDLYLPMQRE